LKVCITIMQNKFWFEKNTIYIYYCKAFDPYKPGSLTDVEPSIYKGWGFTLSKFLGFTLSKFQRIWRIFWGHWLSAVCFLWLSTTSKGY
jgi:hypothetical protein